MKVSIGVVALNEEKTLPSLFEDFKIIVGFALTLQSL